MKMKIILKLYVSPFKRVYPCLTSYQNLSLLTMTNKQTFHLIPRRL